LQQLVEHCDSLRPDHPLSHSPITKAARTETGYNLPVTRFS
jgi:hypothetical protein